MTLMTSTFMGVGGVVGLLLFVVFVVAALGGQAALAWWLGCYTADHLTTRVSADRWRIQWNRDLAIDFTLHPRGGGHQKHNSTPTLQPPTEETTHADRTS